MGIFSKKPTDLDLALNHLNNILINHYQDWAKTLRLALGAKAASEQPIEKVEPFVRSVWVECYVRAIALKKEADHHYMLVAVKTPEIESVLPESEFQKALSDQLRRMGELLGGVVREIGEFSPSHKEPLMRHLQEPELGKIKEEAKRKAGVTP
jgi:hypothetical protein